MRCARAWGVPAPKRITLAYDALFGENQGKPKMRASAGMTRSLEEMEEAIAQERRELDEWLCRTYAEMGSEKYCPEIDISYENWGNIEWIAGSIFNDRQVRKLGRFSIDSLLFFISRSEEAGNIIAWSTSNQVKTLSHCGDLAYDDFLFLAEQAAMRDEDFCDYQIAVCFQKCNSLEDSAVNLLHRFFRRKNSYTRRLSLHTLSHFRHASARELAIDLWHTDQCEHAKLSSLEVLKELPEAKSVFEEFLREYQVLYDIDETNYRKGYIQALMGK